MENRHIAETEIEDHKNEAIEILRDIPGDNFDLIAGSATEIIEETIRPHEMEYLDIENADDNADFYACLNDYDHEADFYGE